MRVTAAIALLFVASVPTSTGEQEVLDATGKRRKAGGELIRISPHPPIAPAVEGVGRVHFPYLDVIAGYDFKKGLMVRGRGAEFWAERVWGDEARVPVLYVCLQVPHGFVTSLKVGSTVLAADLKVIDPTSKKSMDVSFSRTVAGRRVPSRSWLAAHTLCRLWASYRVSFGMEGSQTAWNSASASRRPTR